MLELNQPAVGRLSLGGSLTIYEVREARDGLLAVLAGAPGSHWTLDLSAMQEIDSAGAQLLLAAQRHVHEAGGGLQLHVPTEAVQELLALLRLQALLPHGDDHAR